MRTLLVSMAAVAAFAASAPARAAAPTPELEIINAYDAFGRAVPGLQQDYGFSAVVRYKGRTILFDAGNDASILEKNLFILRVSPKKIDLAIVSHVHLDHISGLDYLLKMNPDLQIYLPYDVGAGAPYQIPLHGPEPEAGASLAPERRYFDGKHDKVSVRSSGRFWKARVEWVGQSKEIAPGIRLVVTPSPLTGSFNKYPPYDKEPFLIPLPELSASFSTSKGEVLIVGCAHSTLDTILQESKVVTSAAPELVLGGFHLIPYKTADIQALAKRMREEYGVRRVAPAHCSGHAAFEVFEKTFGPGYLFFGLGSRLVL